MWDDYDDKTSLLESMTRWHNTMKRLKSLLAKTKTNKYKVNGIYEGKRSLMAWMEIEVVGASDFMKKLLPSVPCRWKLYHFKWIDGTNGFRIENSCIHGQGDNIYVKPMPKSMST